MPISFIQALFFPPGPPIPLCHIVILTGLHHKLLLQQKHRYLHLWYLTAKKNNKEKSSRRGKTHYTYTTTCSTRTTWKWKINEEPGGCKRRPRRTSREPCWASRGCRSVSTGGGEHAVSVSSPLVRPVQQVQVRLRYRLPSIAGVVGARAAHCGPVRPLGSHCSDTGASIDAAATNTAAADDADQDTAFLLQDTGLMNPMRE